jgi:hypothetical protein
MYCEHKTIVSTVVQQRILENDLSKAQASAYDRAVSHMHFPSGIPSNISSPLGQINPSRV